MTAALCLSNIEKAYGKLAVLRGASLTVAPGECVALTGANGCGKSTLLRIAAGLTRPTRGAVQMDGKIGYVPEAFPPIEMTLGRFLRALDGIDCSGAEELAREFQLSGALGAPIRAFSKGMLSKLAAIQALASDAQILLLDEPASGQDADSRALFCEKLREKLRAGAAVLMASHEAELIEALAHRTLRIENGMIAEGERGAGACLCAQCELHARGACEGRGRGECDR